MDEKLSRRNFLKGAATALAVSATGATLSACATDALGTGSSASGSAITWDKEADVVVLGTGAGGLCASIVAARTGATVLNIEKSNEDDQGGNTRVAGNMWTTARTQADVPQYLKYQLAAAETLNDRDYLAALIEAGPTMLNEEFLPSCDVNVTVLGIFSPEFHALPGGDVVQAWQNEATGNSQLWNALRATANDESNIESLFETPGRRLITDNDGMVIGVVAESGGKEINIKAKRGVVIATGGYEFNKYMLMNSYPGWPPFSRGTPYNTGDGILMGQKAGAGLWHMNASDSGTGALRCPGLNFGHGAYNSDDVPANMSMGISHASVMAKNLIRVDKYGKRFMPENREDGHGYGNREYIYFYDGVKCEWPRLPFWTIIDSEGAKTPIGSGRAEGVSFTWFTARSGYDWSADNSAEVAKGWIIKADTIEDLAAQMTAKQAGERTELNRADTVVDPAVLRKTIEDYNGYAAAGLDVDFGRAADTMAPLVGPYYAVQTYPNQYNTQGGLKRNAKSQTLDAFDEPIPHLYSVGECGAGYGWVYNGGWNIAEAMITGIWAGDNVVTNEAWDA